MEATAYKPQSPEVFSSVLEILKKARREGMTRMAVAATDSITRLQFKRWFHQSEVDQGTLHRTSKEAELALSGIE